MSKLYIFGVVLALGFLGGAAVTAQETRPPRPSTSETEGTAADRTPPGETRTHDTMPQEQQGQQGQMDPRPSTSETEGTAADTTPPGRTPTTQEQMGQRGQMGQQGDMVGAAVVTSEQAPVGRVVDMVFDSANQPEFVVVESAGKTVAVPYSVANANKSADKIVIDEARLQGAPKIKQGEWRSGTDETWKKEAKRYWDRG